MRLVLLTTMMAFGGLAALRAETAPALTNWERINVGPMKTSIYLGSVTLTTGVFVRHGSTLTTTYAADVFPWFFWNETGHIVITLSDTDLANIARGEAAQLAGDGVNNKNKPRKVTGRAEPVDATSGKFKIRILADGYTLVFNGTYKFEGSQR
jgi:hypothetical protein